jgi:pimeloyl-ACP methyl ester carboxylesterase
LEQAKDNNLRAEDLSEIFDPLTDDQVRNVTTPTLLLSGTDSVSVWPLLSDRLDELLPTSEHVRIPGASHIVHEDQPDLVVDRIRTFLADQAG